MLKEIFEAFHFSVKESTVVQCLLELGIQRASSVASYCEMPRNTVRGILDKLTASGFLICTRRGNTHFYGVERPEALRRSLEVRRESVIEEVTHQLAALDNAGYLITRAGQPGSRPKVTFYEGFEGLRRVYEDTLDAKEGLRSWGSFDVNQDALPKYFKTYYKRRARRGVRMTSIHPDSSLAREHHRNDARELRQSVLVDQKKFNLSPEIQVYDNKINIVSWRDKLGIIIESQEIAHAMKAIFDLCLEGAAKKSSGKRQRKK